MKKLQKIYKTYVIFGFGHVHYINGIIFDKNCVAVIETKKVAQGREKAFEYFGKNFCLEYSEKHFPFETLDKYYPRGLIKVPKV